MASVKRTVNVRFDKNHVRLNRGEYHRPDGRYSYRWVGPDKKRHVVYASTLDELRVLEDNIKKDEQEDQTSQKNGCQMLLQQFVGRSRIEGIYS